MVLNLQVLRARQSRASAALHVWSRLQSFPCLINCTAARSVLRQVNINECSVAPCLNNGTCVDGVADYTCDCQPGYEGKECQIEVNECAASVCL